MGCWRIGVNFAKLIWSWGKKVLISILQVLAMSRGSPRPRPQKAMSRVQLGSGWGLGLGQTTLDIREFENSNMDTTVQQILRLVKSGHRDLMFFIYDFNIGS